MIILVTANDRPAQQLLVTKRTTIGAVQALLRLQTAKSSPIEWLIDDGSWAAADPDARLYELASDLRGDGSSFKKAFRVRSVAEGADEQGRRSQNGVGAAEALPDAAAASDKPAAAASRQTRVTGEAACAPASPKQLSEAPAPTGAEPQLPAAMAVFPSAISRPVPAATTAPLAADTAAASALAASALAAGAISPVARDESAALSGSMRHSKSHGELSASQQQANLADASGSSGGGAFEAVSRTRLEATLPLLTGGSHIAVVDPRRLARDAMAAALMRALPEVQATTCATPQRFRPLHLTFDSAQPFQAGLDGFWKWVLEGLHAEAPDLFPAAGLPGDASGFEEAFSADRVRAAPPVVLICSEACALAEASSWFVSRFLGTLRDMGNEQHRFFLHAVAMIGGEPLRNVDMEAYMCKMSTSLSSTLASSRSSGKPRSGSVSRRSASSALSKPNSSSTGRHGGSRKQGPLSANSGASGGSGGSSGRSGKSSMSAGTSPAPVRRVVSGSSAMGGALSRRAADGRYGSAAGSGAGSSSAGNNSGDGKSRSGGGCEAYATEAAADTNGRDDRTLSAGKPLSEKVKRLAAAFAGNDGGSTASSGAAPGP